VVLGLLGEVLREIRQMIGLGPLLADAQLVLLPIRMGGNFGQRITLPRLMLSPLLNFFFYISYENGFLKNVRMDSNILRSEKKHDLIFLLQNLALINQAHEQSEAPSCKGPC
jgi:hypothetical protein